MLNLFLAFLQPKFDPSLTQDEGIEDGDSSQPTLPTKQDEEFRPFIRRLPEFKFWHSSTRAIAIAFFCSWWGVFNVPVFWPVLVVYCKLKYHSRKGTCLTESLSHYSIQSHYAETNTAHDQIPLRPFHVRQGKVQPAKWTLNGDLPVAIGKIIFSCVLIPETRKKRYPCSLRAELKVIMQAGI